MAREDSCHGDSGDGEGRTFRPTSCGGLRRPPSTPPPPSPQSATAVGARRSEIKAVGIRSDLVFKLIRFVSGFVRAPAGLPSRTHQYDATTLQSYLDVACDAGLGEYSLR